MRGCVARSRRRTPFFVAQPAERELLLSGRRLMNSFVGILIIALIVFAGVAIVGRLTLGQ